MPEFLNQKYIDAIFSSNCMWNEKMREHKGPRTTLVIADGVLA